VQWDATLCLTAAILFQDMPYFVAGEPVVLPQYTNLRLDLQYRKTPKQNRKNIEIDLQYKKHQKR
jgi:hypothetical protein